MTAQEPDVRGLNPMRTSASRARRRPRTRPAPIADIAASFRVLGGLEFADSQNRGFWNADGNN